MFQHRHYELLADWLAHGTFCTSDSMARNLFASSLADKLERDNPRFDRKRFLKACGADRVTPALRLLDAAE
jgi:hypothetical protein